MSGSRIPVWKTSDHEGTKYFTRKPAFDGQKQIFIGTPITWAEILRNRKGYRVFKKFKFMLLYRHIK